MSAFPNNTFYASGQSFFLSNPVSSITFDGSPQIQLSNNGGILEANGVNLDPAEWSLYPALSNEIMMNNTDLIRVIGSNLYFNNQLIATQSNISNVSDWSLYPALCNVDLDSNGILFGSNLLSNSGTTLYFAGNALDASQWAVFPAVTNVNMSNRIISNTNTVSGPSGNSNLTVSSSSNLILSASNASCNVSPLTFIVGDAGINPLNTGTVNIRGQGGNGGRINMVACNSSITGQNGLVDIQALGGSLLGVGIGGEIRMTATTPVGISNVTSAIKLSASGINSYAGVTSSLASTFGYNYIHGDVGVNLTAGLTSVVPNVPGTVYIYGTTGTEIDNGLYVDEIYPYTNTLTFPNLKIRGNTLTGANVEISNVVQFAGSNLGMTGINSITMTGTSVIGPLNILNMSNGVISNLSNVNGIAYAPTCNWANFPANANVNMSNFSMSNINQLIFAGGSNTGLKQGPGFLGLDYDTVSTITNLGSSNGDLRTRRFIMSDTNTSNVSDDIMLVNAGTVSGVQRIGAVGSNLTDLVAYISDIPRSHGSFYSTSNQSQTVSNVPHAFTYNGSSGIVGLSNVGSRIYSTGGGTYTVGFSIQFARTSGGGATIAEAWLRIDGVDVPNTNSRILLPNAGNGETLMTVPLNVDLTAGQYFEIVMGTPDYTTTIAQAFPARTTPYVAPAIPSIIVSVDQVG